MKMIIITIITDQKKEVGMIVGRLWYLLVENTQLECQKPSQQCWEGNSSLSIYASLASYPSGGGTIFTL